MIPKIIHYCWFGQNPLPELEQRCLASWHEHMLDWEYKWWNEDTFDISSAPLYVRQAYEARKFAFVSDYVRLLHMSLGSIRHITEEILTASEADLVNKGKITEMVAGLEIIKNMPSNMRHELYYWVREEKNSRSEVDYLEPFNARVLPIEVKAETQGGMKSLWTLMREKGLDYALRCSLENFGHFDYEDKLAQGAIRHVDIIPLYAIAQMPIFYSMVEWEVRSKR